MNTVAKGNRTQRKAREYYESQGYAVETARRTSYHAMAKIPIDFFGLWDLICVGREDIRFVQVKTNFKPTLEWEEAARKWPCPKWAVKEIVIYRDYQRGIVPGNRISLPVGD